ncbi:hypothetical protein [Silvanigrella aquatica]|uniref:Uncharacterized protein n=1 Tax=Silvanigrella aquatica TaxID=1915309 RepID=A0A1L4D3E0_9BACT|nr:hypothetical protein [Silvanigrella aquatica]APJ04712.1 hypothetical protein AXG55_12695 [Silvanigrella aquatica]
MNIVKILSKILVSTASFIIPFNALASNKLICIEIKNPEIKYLKITNNIPIYGTFSSSIFEPSIYYNQSEIKEKLKGIEFQKAFTFYIDPSDNKNDINKIKRALENNAHSCSIYNEKIGTIKNIIFPNTNNNHINTGFTEDQINQLMITLNGGEEVADETNRPIF